MSEAVTLATVKAYLRIGDAGEDELLHHLIAAATGACDRYLGRLVMARTIKEDMPVTGWWQRLAEAPVTAITSVEEVAADGARRPLGVNDHAIDIGEGGTGLVRVTVRGPQRIVVTYRAGMAETVAGVPAALAQGIVRYVAHLHAYRDEVEREGLPHAVRAAWQPFRRMRIGGAA